MKNDRTGKGTTKKKRIQVISLFLACLLVFSQVAIVATAAEKTITSITAVAQDVLIENYNGYMTSDWDDEAGSYAEYFYYTIYDSNPVLTVMFSDGTSATGGYYDIQIDGTTYYPSYSTNQSYENAWGVGKHSITVDLYYQGQFFSCNMEVEVVESPVESITATAGKRLIENYDGGYIYGPEGGYWTYSVSSCNPEYTVKYKDGTVYTGTSHDIWEQTGYWPDDYLQQSSEEPLEVGVHSVPISFFGAWGTLEMEIVESPVESITATAGKRLIENYDGGYINGPEEGYRNYSVSSCAPEYTVKYKDGTVYTGTSYDIWEQTGYWPDDYLQQSSEEPLGVGVHSVPISLLGTWGILEMEIVESPVESISVQAQPLRYGVDLLDQNAVLTVQYKDGRVYRGTSAEISKETGYNEPKIDWKQDGQKLGENVGEVAFLGKTFPFTYQVIENPYTSLEILSVEPIEEELDGDYSWSSILLTYRLTQADGTQEVGYTHGYGYVDLGFSAKVEKIGTWGVGEANQFVLTVAGLSAEGTVEIIPKNKDFTYIVFDNNIIITENLNYPENLVIPEEIDGHPVVGISGLKDYGSIKTVTVPDGVRLLSTDWCSDLTNVETITLGKSVSSITCDMFRSNKALKNIIVSADHAEYMSRDGVVYSKDLSALVAYPLGKTGVYTVPAETKNIDALNDKMYDGLRFLVSSGSQSYVTVDGVTYSADMKTVMFCDPEKSGTYVMPDSVEHLNDRAFADCDKLESVLVSENVTEIVYGAFADCTALQSIEIPETVRSIGKQAFENCTSLMEFISPSALTQIDDRAFAKNTSLKTVELTDNIQYIGYSAFLSCNQLDEILLPNGLTEIQSSTFADCAALANITIPESVTSIGEYAFEKCTSLTSIDVPDNVTYLGYYAFAYCKNLQSAKVGSGVTNLNFAFSNCPALAEIFLPDTLTTISAYELQNTAYYDNESNWQDGVLYIDQYLIGAKQKIPGICTVKSGTSVIAQSAFEDCTLLESVTIPNSVTTIGDSAFYGCTALENISLPIGLTSISDMMFYNCRSLTDILIPDSVTSIGVSAFRNCSSLTKLTIPDSVNSIQNRAFSYCTNLSDVQLSKGLQYIGQEAFSNTALDEELVLPSGIEEIDTYAFSYTHISSVRIPETVTDMVYGFYGSDVQEIEMPDTLVSLDHDFHNTPWYDAQPEGAIYLGKMLYFYKGEMRNYTNFVVEEGTLGISDYAFAEQTNLTGISLPEGLLDIGTRSFAECRNLTDITLPSTLQSIQTEAFRNCALETVEIPASITEIGYNAFAGCTSLKEIRVAADNPNYSSIDGVLYNKDGTELLYCPEGKTGTLVLPVQVEKIPEQAFSSTSLTGIVVYNDALEIGAWAFDSWVANKPSFTDKHTPLYLYANRGSTTEAYAIANEQIFVELVGKTDTATDITIEESVQNSVPVNAQLQANQVNVSANRITYNISLLQDGEAVQLTNAVAVKIPVPDTMNGEQCAVYREEADGTKVILNAVYRDGYMVFMTETLGNFVLTNTTLSVALGDVNGDGMIDAADAVMIQRYDSGLTTLTEEQLAAADVNGDGLVDAADAVKIQRYDAGLIAAL